MESYELRVTSQLFEVEAERLKVKGNRLQVIACRYEG